MLDPAMLRSGRFGRHVQIPMPNKEARTAIFKIHIKGKPLDDNIDIEKISEALEGYTGADIKSVCEEATLLTIRKALADSSIDTKNSESVKKVKISKTEFDKAIEKVKNTADIAKSAHEKSSKPPDGMHV